MATCNCIGSLCGKCICACLCVCERIDVSNLMHNDWLTYILDNKIFEYEPEESLENVLPTLPKE